MVDSGALDDSRVELLDGMLVDVTPQGERHARVIQRLMRLCAGRMDLLRVQMPLTVGDGWTPERDLALAPPDPDPARYPSTALLVVEVAATSQGRSKAPASASAGVARYWLVDLVAEVVLDHSDPGPARYRLVHELGGDERLDPGGAGRPADDRRRTALRAGGRPATLRTPPS
ncbi:MAG: Uma2 family endonuclease [Solirubrobacteraceae bacterium]